MAVDSGGPGRIRVLILLASPEAARSEWVTREITYWTEHKPLEKLLIVLTDGEIVWDQAASDFDWARTTALPPVLGRAFADEPRYIDLRWARTQEHLSLNDGRFRDRVADLAASLHHRPRTSWQARMSVSTGGPFV
jgi:hypothetical protein